MLEVRPKSLSPKKKLPFPKKIKQVKDKVKDNKIRKNNNTNLCSILNPPKGSSFKIRLDLEFL